MKRIEEIGFYFFTKGVHLTGKETVKKLEYEYKKHTEEKMELMGIDIAELTFDSGFDKLVSEDRCEEIEKILRKHLLTDTNDG